MEALLHMIWITLLRVSAVLVIGLLAAALLRRASASMRHCLLVLTVIGALVVPWLSVLLPEVRMPLPTSNPVVQPQRSVTSPAPITSSTPQRTAPVPPASASAIAPPQPHSAGGAVPSASPKSPLSADPVEPMPASVRWTIPVVPPVAWLWIWGAGIIILLARFLGGILTTCRIMRQSKPAGIHVLATANEGAKRLGLKSTPQVRVSTRIPVPAVSGVFRMCVFLPAVAETWPSHMLQAALLHELAHVRRRDMLTQALVELLCIVYWFNPLAWLTAWRMRIEREAACDDAVLNAGVPNRAYADVLLDSVKALQERRTPAFAGVTMARTGKLAQRLKAIMDTQRNRKPLTRIGIILLVLIALTVAILVALPGTRTKIAALIPQTPIPENQHLIVTKDKWHLRGPVKRVDLYTFSETRDGRRIGERLLEVMEFDEKGHATLQARYTLRHNRSDIPQETISWQYDTNGSLVGIDQATNALSHDVMIAADLHPEEAYAFFLKPQYRVFVAPPSQTRVEYAPQGSISLITAQAEEKHEGQSLQFDYDTKGNPILVRQFQFRTFAL